MLPVIFVSKPYWTYRLEDKGKRKTQIDPLAALTAKKRIKS